MYVLSIPCSKFLSVWKSSAQLKVIYGGSLTQQLLLAFPSHTIISMPALSPTMTAGNIGTWHKKAGDTLAPGDVLVELETDKAQMDFEFQEEGVLAKILKDSGEKDVAVGNVCAP